MNISKDIKITLNKEEQEAVRKVYAIVAEFANKDLCDKISSCSECPLVVFCPITANASDFEATLNDIANME